MLDSYVREKQVKSFLLNWAYILKAEAPSIKDTELVLVY